MLWLELVLVDVLLIGSTCMKWLDSQYVPDFGLEKKMATRYSRYDSHQKLVYKIYKCFSFYCEVPHAYINILYVCIYICRYLGSGSGTKALARA